MTLSELYKQLPNSKKPLVTSIMKSDNTRLIAIGINAGVVLEKHKAPGRTKLIVIRGKIKYISVHKTYIIDQYHTHDIPLEEIHYVTAETPSIFLLLVA